MILLPSDPVYPTTLFILFYALVSFALVGQILQHDLSSMSASCISRGPPLQISLTAHSSEKSQILILNLDGLRSSILILIGSLPMWLSVICGVSPFFTAYYNAILPPTSMLHLEPWCPPAYAKRVTRQRLMHQWLTRPPPGRSGTPLEVLLPADSMFSLFASARDCRNQIYEIKSVFLHVGTESLNRT